MMIKGSVYFCLSLMLLAACASPKSSLTVELGESCTPATNAEIFHEGLYRSERHGSSDDPYYSWSFIRFFEDCHYDMVSSFHENVNKSASIFLQSDIENSPLTTGRYSMDGSTLKMKDDFNEYIGQISGDMLELEFYHQKTNKHGKEVFTYHDAEAIRQDIYNQTGAQKEAPQP